MTCFNASCQVKSHSPHILVSVSLQVQQHILLWMVNPTEKHMFTLLSGWTHALHGTVNNHHHAVHQAGVHAATGTRDGTPRVGGGTNPVVARVKSPGQRMQFVLPWSRVAHPSRTNIIIRTNLITVRISEVSPDLALVNLWMPFICLRNSLNQVKSNRTTNELNMYDGCV